MPLLYHKTVYYVLALPVYYVITLYTLVVRGRAMHAPTAEQNLIRRKQRLTPTDFEVCRGFVYSRDTLKPNALFVRVFTDARADIDEPRTTAGTVLPTGTSIPSGIPAIWTS